MKTLYIDNLDNCANIQSKFSICPIRKQNKLINRIVHNIIFLLIILSFAVSLVSGENKKVDVNVVVSNRSSNNSENISISPTGSSNLGQVGALEGDKEVSVKQNEINSSFGNSFSELFSYKSDNSLLAPFILLGIILLLIIIYKLKGSPVRKKKAVKIRAK